MRRLKPYLLGLLGWLLHLTSFGQADPAVTSRDIQPSPIIGGVGTPLSMTFTIGNSGALPISGADAINQMGFTITLGNCAPSPAGTGALSGPLLNYFDIIYIPGANAFLATQKTGVVLNPLSVYDLAIAATVTRASSSTAINDIGGSCNIQPSPTMTDQTTDNDFAAIYTHTEMTPMPVALISFTAQAQADHTVRLNWSTSWEQANKAYIVERSKDLVTFDEVGQITDVAGSTKSVSTYQLKDTSPYRGTSYYRLRQLDLNGSSRTYPAVSVNLEGVYGVYPNPISANGFTLSLDEPATAVLHLYNTSGRTIDLQKAGQTEGSVELKMTESLPSGIYLLTVEERAQVRKYRLVVQYAGYYVVVSPDGRRTHQLSFPGSPRRWFSSVEYDPFYTLEVHREGGSGKLKNADVSQVCIDFTTTTYWQPRRPFRSADQQPASGAKPASPRGILPFSSLSL
ncbi:hypothetical protein BH09BAC4_BH09BAC4_44770 [soil metagenome]